MKRMKSLSFLLVLLLLYTTVVSSTAAPTISEKSILLEFYQATGGPKWKTNHGWTEDSSSSEDVCSWHGVICVGEEDELGLNSEFTMSKTDNYQVIGIALKENNLVGRTPESIYTLPNLLSLYLSYNPNLDVSFLGGEQATKLLQLKLHATGVTSMNGLDNFRNSLESLHMSGDKITDTAIPPQIFSLTKLKELHMATNKFQGTLPQDISKLQALETLNIYNNNLSGTIPFSFSQLTNLKVLTLTGNRFTGTIPTFLENMPGLVDLYMDGNQFKGPLPALSGLKNLKVRTYVCTNE